MLKKKILFGSLVTLILALGSLKIHASNNTIIPTRFYEAPSKDRRQDEEKDKNPPYRLRTKEILYLKKDDFEEYFNGRKHLSLPDSKEKR